ncbi:hypothetical protein I3842_08G164700 [Carya illinoinensis]|uniref:Cullin N-terminal domain-containing protein n=1 Tax=Carya illinoinensis TaxID=32201 RepID=A0A922EGH5_CARIL|nr:hypothetical protein I3842_08G164700 [Carya illinoinensis]
MRQVVMLDEGLRILEEGIVKAKNILIGHPPKALFSSEDYMKFYNCVYTMCSQRPPYDYSGELYERYKTALEESIVSVVLPSLNDKHDACLLADLLQIWTNYKVWSKLYGNFLDAAISLINQDRNGKQVQQDLLKDVLTFSTFFAEIGEQKIEYYEMFEQIMLKEAASYYAQLASELLCCRSYTDYIQTVAWLLIQERERSVRYLQQGSVEKLLEIVKRKLMDETAQLLVEKQKTESHDTATYQDLLSKCAGMSLGEESSVSPLTQCPFLQ